MITIWNPTTGEWERIDDVNRPFPVIARDTRLVIYNPNQIVVSATTPSQNNIDPLGTSGANAPATIDFPAAWRVRRVIITTQRECTDTLQATLEARLYGRLTDSGGNPVSNTWYPNFYASANDGTAVGGVRNARLVLPGTLSGVFGFDQYRITFHMSNQTGTGEFRLSHIKVYVEM